MRVLLDECVPCQMGCFLPATVSVRSRKWVGRALRMASCSPWPEQKHFEVFVTADKNISYQQVIRGRPLGLVELPTNILPLLRSLAAPFQEAVSKVRPGQYVELSFPQP